MSTPDLRAADPWGYVFWYGCGRWYWDAPWTRGYMRLLRDHLNSRRAT